MRTCSSPPSCFLHFLGPDDIAWLANFKDLHLSDEDARALIFLREAGAINNAAYRMLNRVDTLTASTRLRNPARHQPPGAAGQRVRRRTTYQARDTWQPHILPSRPAYLHSGLAYHRSRCPYHRS